MFEKFIFGSYIPSWPKPVRLKASRERDDPKFAGLSFIPATSRSMNIYLNIFYNQLPNIFLNGFLKGFPNGFPKEFPNGIPNKFLNVFLNSRNIFYHYYQKKGPTVGPERPRY